VRDDRRKGSLWTRREFARCAALAGVGLSVSCGGDNTAQLRETARRLGASLDCSDISGLQAAEARTREDNTYRQHTEKDDQFCLNCLNFVPSAVVNTCASCKTVRGPINPDGWCRQWTKQRG
jgi:hypothetical protein